jgi:hypothetical protein
MDAPDGQTTAQDPSDLPPLPRGHPRWPEYQAIPEMITGEQGAGNSQALFWKRPTEKDPTKGTSPAVDFILRAAGGEIPPADSPASDWSVLGQRWRPDQLFWRADEPVPAGRSRAHVPDGRTSGLSAVVNPGLAKPGEQARPV